jgi:hypothetical protein
MSLSITDITDAKQAAEPVPPKGIRFNGWLTLPKDFPELKLFALLKWRFGGPNGILSFVGKPGGDPDAPFKWDFVFCPYQDINFQIIRGVSNIEVRWWGGAVTEKEVIEYLHYNIGKHPSEIDKSISELEPYTLILNPYIRHKALIQWALDDLKRIKPSAPLYPSGNKTSNKDIDRFKKQYQMFMKQVEAQASLTMLVVLESAFMAEAYLNLILAFMLRPEIRKTKNIYQETIMRKWRSKVERLPIDCLYIQSQPNMGDARVRDAQIMFDLRNRVAHSYPDKEDLKVGEMWFHRSFPILEKAEPFHKFSLALHNQLPSVDDAMFCSKASAAFISFLEELLAPQIKDDFVFASEANPLGYNESKGIYGVPFGKFMIVFTGAVSK